MRHSEAAVALVRRVEGGQPVWLVQWNAGWRRFHLVGGHRQPDETFRACLVREVHEELGLAEGADFSIAPGPPARAEFTAFSQGAGVPTCYTMELFDVELTPGAVAAVTARPENRWVSEPEIRQCRCRDGRPLSDTTRELLARRSALGGG